MPAHLIAEEGPHRGLVLNLEESGEWIVGRDPDEADFLLEDSTVSRKHVQLTKTEEGVYLKNLSRVNPTRVNDEEIEGRHLLQEGDRVTVGNTVFLFSEEEVPTAEKKPAGGYDEIFGDLEEEPEAPPEEEPAEKEPALPQPKAEGSAYDTIFEDVGEELPFHLLKEDTPYVLKVISGPNAGAEIGIEKGRSYIIGKDSNECDIAFQDLSVSRTHSRLSVSEEGEITIEDLDSKNGTIVGGVAILEKKVITPQDLIALGTTAFLIIDRQAPQETIYSPITPSYELTEEEEKPLDDLAAKDWRSRPIPTKYLVLAGSLAAIFLIAFLSFFSLFKPKGFEVAHKEPVSDIEKALKKFHQVQFSFNPGSGKLFLVGHVLTAVDYAEMRYGIDQIDFIASVEDTVVIDEYVWKSMNEVLSGNEAWRGVSISAPKAGKFVVNGYIQGNDQAVQLWEYLTVNFPYLDRLQNRIVVEENLQTELQGMLAYAGLGAVTMQLANGEVILAGRYSDTKEEALKELIAAMDKVHGVAHVRNFAVPTSPHLAAIDVTQQFQIGGSSLFDGHGYSVVLNGKIYTLGEAIDGMKITDIESSMILLEKDGLKYKIDYTR